MFKTTSGTTSVASCFTAQFWTFYVICTDVCGLFFYDQPKSASKWMDDQGFVAWLLMSALCVCNFLLDRNQKWGQWRFVVRTPVHQLYVGIHAATVKATVSTIWVWNRESMIFGLSHKLQINYPYNFQSKKRVFPQNDKPEFKTTL